MPSPKVQARHDALAAKLKKRKLSSTRGRAPLPFSTRGAELVFFRSVRALVNVTRKQFQEALRYYDPQIRREFLAATPEVMRKDDGLTEIKRLMASLKIDVEREWTQAELERIAARQGRSVDEVVKKSVSEQWRRVLGLDPIQADKRLGTYLKQRVAQNVAMIQSIPERHYPTLETGLLNAYQAGRPVAEIASYIDDRFDVMEGNAMTIARTETGKLYADLTEFRQRDLGIEKYTWVTAHDERVSNAHAELETRETEFGSGIYSWADAPTDSDGNTGHPGAIRPNCRCVALPYFGS